MIGNVQIRPATPSDYTALGRVLYETVHLGAYAYTPAQRRAWQPAPNVGAQWNSRLARQRVWVAASRSIGPVGFMTLEDSGEIDLAYILGQWQGKGIFAGLYQTLETEARAMGLTRLSVFASLHATPAFTHYGFRKLRDATVQQRGETLARFELEKALPAS